MKKYSLFILVAILFSVTFYSCQSNQKDNYVIAIIPKVDNKIFDQVKESAIKAGDELGVTITWEAPTSNHGIKQVELIENMIKYKVDAILISCNDQEMLKEPINKAIEAGIKVATFDSDCPESNRVFYVGTNNEKAGKVCAETMQKLFEKAGKTPQNIVLLSGGFNATNMKERMSNYISTIGTEKVTDVINTFEMADYGMERLSMSLIGNSKIEGIQMISGIATQHDLDSIPVFTQFINKGGIGVFFDVSKPLLRFIKDHPNCATMKQDFTAMGSSAVKNMVKALKGDSFEKEIKFDVEVIDQAAATELLKKTE